MHFANVKFWRSGLPLIESRIEISDPSGAEIVETTRRHLCLRVQDHSFQWENCKLAIFFPHDDDVAGSGSSLTEASRTTLLRVVLSGLTSLDLENLFRSRAIFRRSDRCGQLYEGYHAIADILSFEIKTNSSVGGMRLEITADLRPAADAASGGGARQFAGTRLTVDAVPTYETLIAAGFQFRTRDIPGGRQTKSDRLDRPRKPTAIRDLLFDELFSRALVPGSLALWTRDGIIEDEFQTKPQHDLLSVRLRRDTMEFTTPRRVELLDNGFTRNLGWTRRISIYGLDTLRIRRALFRKGSYSISVDGDDLGEVESPLPRGMNLGHKQTLSQSIRTLRLQMENIEGNLQLCADGTLNEFEGTEARAVTTFEGQGGIAWPTLKFSLRATFPTALLFVRPDLFGWRGGSSASKIEF